MSGPTGSPIVVAFPTIMSGLVLRWYRTADAYRRHTEVCSASRDGVSIHTEYLHQVPAGWLEDAVRAHQLLARGRDDQAEQEIATHRPTGILAGTDELKPITRPACESTPGGEA